MSDSGAPASQSQDAARFREARDRGCAYLLRQQLPDGGFGLPERGLADYYKVPAAYLVCGATAAANRLCQWIRKHGMTIEGDFGPRLPETIAYYYLYYNTWVITGAHRLGQFDLSQKGMDFVLRFQDCESGGFFSRVPPRELQTRNRTCGWWRAPRRLPFIQAGWTRLVAP